jgi:hypothetical protein
VKPRSCLLAASLVWAGPRDEDWKIANWDAFPPRQPRPSWEQFWKRLPDYFGIIAVCVPAALMILVFIGLLFRNYAKVSRWILAAVVLVSAFWALWFAGVVLVWRWSNRSWL